MEDIGIDADHQQNIIISRGDVFGRIAQVIVTAELLEADKVREILAQVEEQIGARGKAVIGAVIDDRRQVWPRSEWPLK
jgi:hypothetical protein